MANNNQAWKMESMKPFKRHIDPEMEERMKWTKIETEKKLRRTLKLVKSINQNKEGNAKKKAELYGIIEEISKEFKSMHDLYDSLTSEARRLFSAENETESSSGYSSAGDVEFHTPKGPDTPISLASREEKKKAKKNKNLDPEDALLKDKLTSSSEVEKRVIEDGETEPEPGLIFKDVEIEDERFLALDEQKKAEIKILEEKINDLSAKNKAQTEENSVLKARIGDLEQLSAVIKKLEQDKKGLEAEVNEMSAKNKAQTEENSVLKARIGDLEQLSLVIKKLEQDKIGLEAEVNAAKNKVQTEENSVTKTRIGDLEQLSSVIKKLEQDKIGLEAEVTEMSTKIKAQTDENSVLKARIGDLEQLSLLIKRMEQDKKGLEEELAKNMAFNEEEVKELENQIMCAKSEAYKLRVENERLYARIFVLETTVKKRETESLALREKTEAHEIELQNLQEKIQSLEEQHSFQQKIEDQQKLITDMGNEMNGLKEEKKIVQNKLNEAKSNYQFAEKKVEDMSEEFFKKCEDQVRILSRRIRVAEQLHLESKDWYKKTKHSFEQQNQELKDRLEQNEVWIRNITDISQTAENTLSFLESIALKFDGFNSNFENRISKVSCELKFAKGWVARKNKAVANAKNDINNLLSQLGDKEAEILRYREKVWRSEHKARELEKMVSEKDEGMLALQEEKREAIRQLCVWIDYHRGRSDYYKKVLSDMNVSSGKKGR